MGKVLTGNGIPLHGQRATHLIDGESSAPHCLTIRAFRFSSTRAWDSKSLISSGNTPISRGASSWLLMLPVATISSLPVC
jgi:hypothetical protein